MATPGKIQSLSYQLSGRFIDHPQVGWLWECCSQWLLYYFHNDLPPSIMGWLEAHHQPLDSFDTRYDSWLFLYHLAVRLSCRLLTTQPSRYTSAGAASGCCTFR